MCLFLLFAFFFFSPLAAKLIGPKTGRQFFKNPLNSMSYLRGEVWFMEIVFVGECEVFVCLCFCCLLFFFSPLAAKLIGPKTGRQFFKN